MRLPGNEATWSWKKYLVLLSGFTMLVTILAPLPWQQPSTCYHFNTPHYTHTDHTSLEHYLMSLTYMHLKNLMFSYVFIYVRYVVGTIGSIGLQDLISQVGEAMRMSAHSANDWHFVCHM